MVTLTLEERKRFAQYLRDIRDSNLQLIGQMEKIPAGMDAMIKKLKTDNLAFSIVAKNLDDTEEEVIK